MKLAELLIERSENQKRISVLANRLNTYATVQEGDTAPINVDFALRKLNELFVKQEELIKKINKTNMVTELEPGLTLADAVCKRDIMKNKRGIYSSLFSASAIQENRYSKKEIKFVNTLDVDMITDVMDDLAKNIRVLDGKIQAKNWEVVV